MATFMNSWATACRSGIHKVTSPYFELSSVFPVEGSMVTHGHPPRAGVKFEMKRLSFNGVTLSRLKLAVAKNRQTSRVEVVSALLCKAFVTMDQAKHGRLRPLVVLQNMNLYGRVNLPIPSNTFGNVYTKVVGQHTLHENGLTLEAFVKVIRNAFVSAKIRYTAIANRELCMDMVKDSARECEERFSSDQETVVAFTSWCGFQFYDVNFRWGKPDLVSCTLIPVPLIALIDSKSEGGIDAWIILSQEEKVLLEQDPDIAAFAS